MKVKVFCLFLLFFTVLNVYAGNKYYKIISSNNLCLDVDGNQVTNYTPVKLYPCHGRDNQLWYTDSRGRLHPKSAKKMCLDAGLPGAGNNTYIKHCKNQHHQAWFFSNGYIYNGGDTNFVLDYGSSNRAVFLSEFNANATQQWRQVLTQPKSSSKEYSFTNDESTKQYFCFNDIWVKIGPVSDFDVVNTLCPMECEEKAKPGRSTYKWNGKWKIISGSDGTQTICNCRTCVKKH
ncbi:RICIN domain-containing protein [Zooshikella harenae]|uniref:RICIN domain-containing protein n=1 Tax=Zooshikella harenae TaxID=2827238 RepID=A0ABS5ZIJ2_9GAMM|nr:RICIN domain-containing protein [Zooshikella harenae]MBU2713886.1 RICIN domain-containing protein [Zooshikella harenae]